MAAPFGNKYGEGEGRPTDYSDELANKICVEIATTSKSLKTICSQEGFPSAVTVLHWRNTNESFLNQYTRAKEDQADLLAEEILDIADDGSNDFMTVIKGDTSYEIENKEWTSRSKLRVESRKWIASKLKPKKYGDKLATENRQVDREGNDVIPVILDWKTAVNATIKQDTTNN